MARAVKGVVTKEKLAESRAKAKTVKQNPKDPKPSDFMEFAERDVKKLQEVLQSLQLRKGGATYANIARSLGISEYEARENVCNEAKRLVADIQEEAKEHRQLQLERLNEMMMSYWPRRADPKFGGMILALMNKQDALLGIVAEKLDVTVTHNPFDKLTDAELDTFLASKVDALKKPVPISLEER